MSDNERHQATQSGEGSNNAAPQPDADADSQRLRRADRRPDEEVQPGAEVHPATVDEESRGETNVLIVREGIQRYGQPFLAYLILDGVEQRSQDLIEQYEQRYIGSFPDRRSFATWAITDQGWSEELVALRRLQGMWPDPVRWNLDLLWPALVERYALTERLGGVHAFRR